MGIFVVCFVVVVIEISYSSVVGGRWVNGCDKNYFGDYKEDDISFSFWIWLLVKIFLRIINILK